MCVSEARVAVSDGWTERTVRPSGAKRGGTPRSLGAALRDAGLSDAAPDPREDDDDEGLAPRHRSASSSRSIPDISQYRSPRLAVFAEAEHAAHDAAVPEVVAAVVMPVQHESVVSPPPWLRAARRGRRRERLSNTFGWVMTIVVAGSIIGIAGHYLAVPPLGIATTMQARQ